MKDLLVSIIIPVYNCERFLEQCLESVLGQTHKALEIILIDDGSRDGSASLCDMYLNRDQRIKVIHKKNQGAAAARKSGIEVATGRFVMFVDADDWLDDDYVEKLLLGVQKKGTDIVIGLMIGFDDEKITEYHHYFPNGYYNRERLWQEIYPNMLSATPYYTFGIAPSMCGKLFACELVQKNKDKLEAGITFGEDGCFTYAALLDAEAIYITNVCGYHYRTNVASATHSFNEKLWKDGQKLKDFYTNLIEEKCWEVGTQLDEYMTVVCNYTITKAIKAGCAKHTQGRMTMKQYVRNILLVKLFENEKLRRSSLRMKIKFALMKCCAFRLLAIIINAK